MLGLALLSSVRLLYFSNGIRPPCASRCTCVGLVLVLALHTTKIYRIAPRQGFPGTGGYPISESDKWDLPSFVLFFSAHRPGRPSVHIHRDRSTVSEIIPHRKGGGEGSHSYALLENRQKHHLANHLCHDYFFITVAPGCTGSEYSVLGAVDPQWLMVDTTASFVLGCEIYYRVHTLTRSL